MHLILETLVCVVLFLYYCLEAIVLLFVPSSFRRKNVQGQTVLITGAGSGLGRLMSIQFAKLGCTLVLLDVNERGNEETASQVREFGATVHAFTCDLSKREDIYRVAEQAKSDVGDVDILINNAGIVTGKKFLECPDSLIIKTMDVNINAHFWTVKSFLPAMLRRNKGHIVTVSSAAGHFGANSLADYCASKFAAYGFDESIRVEISALKKTGVHTTVVCPYYINTGMFEGAKTRFPTLLPFLEPDYVVDKIVDAVLTNQAVLCIPRFVYTMSFLKGIIPTKALLLTAQFLGFSASMDDFRGRAKKE